MPGLLLQKHLRKSKSKYHLKSLENQIKLWPSTIAEIFKKITLEMRKGNIESALKLLADDIQIGILPLNDQTLHQIKQHCKDPDPEVLSSDISEEMLPYQILFDRCKKCKECNA